MHRLASKACWNQKGITGLSIAGRPIAFIKKAFLFIGVNTPDIILGNLATVAKTSIIADAGNFENKIISASPFACFSHTMMSETIIYTGEKIPI